ncbi:MAG: tetratricopeptide repeat protein, partial [Bacteroidales bacterium]|nr:tetratricopeptide repeat protein [Bacteroidales bacterium]
KTLKKVITNYPGSSESQEALISLRNIYIDINKVNEFYKYAENLSFVSITVSEQDSMTYIAAENQYFDGNCEKAISTFTDYIQKFPKGAFAINANYYKAECEFKRDSLTNALTGYEFVINHPETQFTGKALVKAAYINFNFRNYESALQNYIDMEENAEDKTSIINAIEGQMRCNYLLNNYDKTITAAHKLLRTEKVSNEQIIEAHFTLANSYMALGDLSNAKKEFNITNKLTDSETGAESQYYVALILFETGKYKEAEKTVFELVDHYSSYDYWVAKTFILMADIYIELDNTFQAKQTLQSIIDNYEGPELSEIAYKKLNNILEKENQETQVEEEDIEE